MGVISTKRTTSAIVHIEDHQSCLGHPMPLNLDLRTQQPRTAKAPGWVCFEPQNKCGKLQEGRSLEEALEALLFLSHTYTLILSRSLSTQPFPRPPCWWGQRREEGGSGTRLGSSCGHDSTESETYEQMERDLCLGASNRRRRASPLGRSRSSLCNRQGLGRQTARYCRHRLLPMPAATGPGMRGKMRERQVSSHFHAIMTL